MKPTPSPAAQVALLAAFAGLLALVFLLPALGLEAGLFRIVMLCVMALALGLAVVAALWLRSGLAARRVQPPRLVRSPAALDFDSPWKPQGRGR